ncbi:MAG: ABC transporter permease [Bacteroidota bacterium]
MFKIYFKVAIRNLLRNRLHAAVNILGLSVGIAVSIIVFLYLQSELTYDNYHRDSDNLYRMASNFVTNGDRERTAISASGLGPLLKEQNEFIAGYTRTSFLSRSQMSSPHHRSFEEDLMAADEHFFQVFDYPMIQGNPHTCLAQPRSIVLSRSLARKYFGDRNPIGQTMTSSTKRSYRVTGVIEDIPRNTHHYFNGLISLSSIPRKDLGCLEGQDFNLWAASVYTFLRLEDGYTPEDFYVDFPEFYTHNMAAIGNNINGFFYPYLQPLRDIHLDPPLDYDNYDSGNLLYIYGFSAIGLFLMLLAAINYTNMATARSTTRAREVGLRKVMGSRRRQLVIQFLGESLLTSLIALLLALALVEVTLELTNFNLLLGKELSLKLLENPGLGLAIVGITGVIGLLSGLYPAFFLSATLPSQALRPRGRQAGRGLNLRKGLVVFQFTVSIGVIIATFLMKNQIDYMRNVNIGDNGDNTVVLPLYDTTFVPRLPTIRAEIERLPGVVATTTARHLPGGSIARLMCRIEKDNAIGEAITDFMEVGYDYLPGMDLKIVAGSDFPSRAREDSTVEYIINQTAAREFFGGDAIGKRIMPEIYLKKLKPKFGKVIGVVEDFNVHSLRYEMRPMVLKPEYPGSGLLHVRLEADQVLGTMENLEQVWAELTSTQTPFTPFFFTERFEKLYIADDRLSGLMRILASLCVLISILGLLGFASYSIEQRKKEIGIRKVLGASIMQIVTILFREVFYLVLFSIGLGSILAYLVLQVWLEQFAYHADIPIATFFLAGIFSLLLALVTVSYHSVRAALSNPVHALKYE